MKITFYLNHGKREVKNGGSIVMSFQRKGERITWYTGHTIKREYWDTETQRGIVNETTIPLGINFLNEFLDKIESDVERLWRQELLNRPPRIKRVKANLERIYRRYTNERYFNQEIQQKKRSVENLEPAYVRQLAIKSGWPKDAIKEFPQILRIQLLKTLSIRTIKKHENV